MTGDHSTAGTRSAATRIALIAALCLAPAASVLSQAPAPASPPPSAHPLFRPNDAILAGSFVVGTLALRRVDEMWARKLQNPRNQTNRFFEKLATGLRTIADPGSYLIGTSMYAVGRLSHQKDLADLGLHGTEALVVGAGTAFVLKGAFGRARPYVHPPTDSTGFDANSWQFGRGYAHEQYRSFPSGHTVAAFAAAAAVANETSRWWPRGKWVVGPAMYGGAALVGLSRMYNNRHWASDVMMGAAIGTFAGNKVVRYHHRTNPGNRFDRWLLNASLSPSAGGGYSLGLSVLPTGY